MGVARWLPPNLTQERDLLLVATVQPPMRDNESLNAEVDSLWTNVHQLADRTRMLEKALDTRATPLWRRLLFRLDGWPAWYRVVTHPAWRPWRRWWVS